MDRELTMAFSDLIEDCYLGGVWRNVLAGGVMWGALRTAFKAVPNSDCPWCRAAEDTTEHLMVHCPAFQPLREWLGVASAQIATLPPCLRYHGVSPLSWEGVEVAEGDRTRHPALPPAHWAHALPGLQRYQTLLLACHAVRGAAEMQEQRLHEEELPLDLRKELHLVALNAGLNVGPMPRMANPEGVRDIQIPAVDSTAAGGG